MSHNRDMTYKSADLSDGVESVVLEGERAAFAETLAKILKDVSGSIVVNIDAPWGYGKSHFVKGLLPVIQKADLGAQVIVINAWEYDFVDDPFTCIFNELEQYITDQSTKDKGALLSQALTIGKIALKAATNIDLAP